MRNHRSKVANQSPPSVASDMGRKINALVYLLEEKGVLAVGEFEDAIMNLKVQMGDQAPVNGRPRPSSSAPGRRGGGPDYIGPERRRQLDSEREGGQERRDHTVRVPVAHISGEVVNEVDRHAIMGVQLILRRSSQNNPPIQFRSTKTDMQGRFVFLNLPLVKEGESDQAYAYHLEVRYRNRTVFNDPEVALIPGQTTFHPIQVAPLEA